MSSGDVRSASLGAALLALLEREPLLKSLGDTAPAGIFVADSAGRFVYTNPRFLESCGLASAAAADAVWLTCVHPDDRERLQTEWAATVATPVEWQSEFRSLCHGQIAHLELRTAPLSDAQGTVTGHIGTIHDVSLRTRLRSKLFALIEASRLLLQSPRLGAVLPATMKLAKDLIAADGYALWRLHGSSDWRIVASTGISSAFADAVILSFRGQTVTAMPFSTPAAVEDVSAAPMLAERQAAYAAEGIRSILVVPLSISNRLSGSLVFYYRSKQRFDQIRTETAAALGNRLPPDEPVTG